MESRKMGLMNLFAWQQWRHRRRGHGGWGRRGWMNGASITEIFTLPHVKQTAGGDLLVESGNSDQGSVMT